jgi:molybdopterin-containing oxidoreductase family membrane subunit
MGMWPQFRSPLVWDVFAISTYATVSLLFWYVGLIPDLATLRDRAKNIYVRYIYGFFALGWRGSALHWKRFNTAYLLLAALATPLVVSVHTVVSFDFAVSVVPGWHVTVFPPYFVAGAVFSGFAMVLTLTIPIRKIFGMEDFITARHLNNMAKIILATGLFVLYGYIMEVFFGWYSANEYDHFLVFNTRFVGPMSWAFWTLIFCNGVVPQLLWFSQVRANPVILWIISIVVNIGMWFERFVIVVMSLHRDFLPSAWGNYVPSFWDITLYLGTVGMFFTFLILFIRVLPMISIFEMRELAHHKEHHDKPAPGDFI